MALITQNEEKHSDDRPPFSIFARKTAHVGGQLSRSVQWVHAKAPQAVRAQALSLRGESRASVISPASPFGIQRTQLSFLPKIYFTTSCYYPTNYQITHTYIWVMMFSYENVEMQRWVYSQEEQTAWSFRETQHTTNTVIKNHDAMCLVRRINTLHQNDLFLNRS